MSLSVFFPSPTSEVLTSAIRKSRRRLLPFLVLMYILAFIDRANISFAKNAFQADTGVSNTAFAFGAGIFFIGYAVLEVPSNMMLYQFGARIWMSRIMVSWGLVAGSLAFVNNEIGFYIVRFLLGVAEAGFFPGIIYYLSTWFPARERGQAMGLFYFGLPLALILGGPISGFLLDIANPFGLRNWQFLFAVEGLAASLAGVFAFFFLTDRPNQAKWLTDDERRTLAAAIDAEDADRRRHGPATFLAAVRNPRVIAFCLVYFAIQMSVYGVVFYLPSRIAELMKGQHVGTVVGLISAIPWIAALVVTLLVTRQADRSKTHRQWAVAMLLLAAFGMSASALCQNVTLAVGAFCFATAGFVSVQPLYWTLPANYLSGIVAATGLALINSIGNVGGFVAPNLKSFVETATGNPQTGMYALAFVSVIGAGLLYTLKPRIPAETGR
jgi:sugar phosphate permease